MLQAEDGSFMCEEPQVVVGKFKGRMWISMDVKSSVNAVCVCERLCLLDADMSVPLSP